MNFYEYLVAFYNITICTKTKRKMKTVMLNWGRMSSCNTKSGIRTRTKHNKSTRTSAKLKGVSGSCGQLCKNFRGLKLHQIKAKCQTYDNKLTGPDKRCFVTD